MYITDKGEKVFVMDGHTICGMLEKIIEKIDMVHFY